MKCSYATCCVDTAQSTGIVVKLPQAGSILLNRLGTGRVFLVNLNTSSSSPRPRTSGNPCRSGWVSQSSRVSNPFPTIGFRNIPPVHPASKLILDTDSNKGRGVGERRAVTREGLLGVVREFSNTGRVARCTMGGQ